MWILILFAHVGAMCSGNSNSLASVPGFHSSQACVEAGKAAMKLASGSCKEIVVVCVKDQVP